MQGEQDEMMSVLQDEREEGKPTKKLRSEQRLGGSYSSERGRDLGMDRRDMGAKDQGQEPPGPSEEQISCLFVFQFLSVLSSLWTQAAA